ncbi:Uncharacterized protein DBV15_07795 [Temnothorax longispinosus]|uniref:Uncharacterized protein n=1 Tax=Temnothorax longispinosus TaxID=300112 RepID=A0A4V6RGK2_9HYME|nr:Uncharacterized protein DBV15_07795 [Temnothorax longispinosus]
MVPITCLALSKQTLPLIGSYLSYRVGPALLNWLVNENIRGRGNRGRYSAKMGGQQGRMIEEINERDEDKGLRGTYVDPPGADPLSGAPDIRHRKPREIVPQVSADASIKTR